MIFVTLRMDYVTLHKMIQMILIGREDTGVHHQEIQDLKPITLLLEWVKLTYFRYSILSASQPTHSSKEIIHFGQLALL